MQRILNFADVPIPEKHVWEELEDEDKAATIEVLGRLLAKATVTKQAQQECTDDGNI